MSWINVFVMFLVIASVPIFRYFRGWQIDRVRKDFARARGCSLAELPSILFREKVEAGTLVYENIEGGDGAYCRFGAKDYNGMLCFWGQLSSKDTLVKNFGYRPYFVATCSYVKFSKTAKLQNLWLARHFYTDIRDLQKAS